VNSCFSTIARSLAIRPHPIANGMSVVRVFQKKLLFFEASDDFGAAMKRWVCASSQKK